MPLFEHVNERGEVDERVNAPAGTKNGRALAAKARDDASGWRLAEPKQNEEPSTGEQPSPTGDVRRGRGTARIALGGGTGGES